jgi:hypothetical protein
MRFPLPRFPLTEKAERILAWQEKMVFIPHHQLSLQRFCAMRPEKPKKGEKTAKGGGEICRY